MHKIKGLWRKWGGINNMTMMKCIPNCGLYNGPLTLRINQFCIFTSLSALIYFEMFKVLHKIWCNTLSLQNATTACRQQISVNTNHCVFVCHPIFLESRRRGPPFLKNCRSIGDEDRGRGSAACMQPPLTELCLALDHMSVLPVSVPTSLAGFIITVQVGTFNRQLAVVGLR